MKMIKLLNDLNKLKGTKYENLPVKLESANNDNVEIAAIVLIDKPNKYTFSHICFCDSLQYFLYGIRLNYNINENNITDRVIPISGFTFDDILKIEW